MASLLRFVRHPRVRKIISITLLLYVLGAMILYFFQETFIFRARTLPPTYTFSSALAHQEIKVAINSQDTLHAVLYKSKKEFTKGLVLYFHGNRQNISWYEKFVPFFTEQGYEVLMPDYPGYGKSKGTISEKKLYEWAALSYQLAIARFAADSIIIYGKSLGTGVATQLASRRDCRKLILETPYYQFPDVVQRFLPIYPVSMLLLYELPTYQYLPYVTAPVTILHGTDDGIISYSQSQRLSTLFKKGDQLITIKEGSHNDLFSFPETLQHLSTLLDH
jgi:pimeloyl-ACP methyl ester carboxylesterase